MSTSFPNFHYSSKGLDSLIADLEAMDKSIEKELRREEKLAEQDLKKHAAKAREGILGPEWKALQDRIDKGRTTLSAVLSGEDTSREAQTVRGYSMQNLTSLHDEWEEERRRGGATPLDELEELRTIAEERYQQLRDLANGGEL